MKGRAITTLNTAKEGPNDSAKEYHAWLERADELEGME